MDVLEDKTGAEPLGQEGQKPSEKKVRPVSVSMDLVSKILYGENKEELELLVLSTQLKLMYLSSAVHAPSLNQLCKKIHMAKATFYRIQKYEAFRTYLFYQVTKNGMHHLTARNIRFNGRQFKFVRGSSEGCKFECVEISEKELFDRRKIKNKLFETYMRKDALVRSTFSTDNSRNDHNIMRNDGGNEQGSFQGTSYRNFSNMFSISTRTAKKLVKKCEKEGLIKKVTRRIYLGKEYSADVLEYHPGYKGGKLVHDSHFNLFVQLPNVYLPGKDVKPYKLEIHHKKGWIPKEEKWRFYKRESFAQFTDPDIYEDGTARTIEGFPTDYHNFLKIGEGDGRKKKKGQTLKDKRWNLIERLSVNEHGGLPNGWKNELFGKYGEAMEELKEKSYLNSEAHQRLSSDEATREIEATFVEKNFGETSDEAEILKRRKPTDEFARFLKNAVHSIASKAKRLKKDYDKFMEDKAEQFKAAFNDTAADETLLEMQGKRWMDFIPEATAWKGERMAKGVGCPYKELGFFGDIYRLGVLAEYEMLSAGRRK